MPASPVITVVEMILVPYEDRASLKEEHQGGGDY
jgi:hypothetical protein